MARQLGTVKWFNVTRGFGFITPESGSKDLFVHQSSIRTDGFRSLGDGETVEFVVEEGPDGRSMAADVTGPNEGPVRGSRCGYGGDRYKSEPNTSPIPVTVADECTVLGVSCNPKSFGKSLAASDEVQPKEDLKTLKILSYNVWFAEDIELRIRMRAIGDIIQLHTPDVICLQEVTPDIYAILQRSNWWKSYKCSLSFDTANTRPYFCMQLSKLPVKSYSCKQFSYSAMGRELCIAEVSAQGGTPLVVATTHLESPCPGPPKWDQMYSKERVKQAQEAVAFLKVNPNVIFCGDMNWDDKLDGEFPLPDGWIDAWTELNPKEIGWTYDTKSNPMLSANRKLQKRLDRFLVGLRDFKVERVEMVGTEAIPEVTYMKQKKGGKELELPVLPSDHFGLLLTMAAL